MKILSKIWGKIFKTKEPVSQSKSAIEKLIDEEGVGLKSDTEYNKKLHEKLLREVDLLKSSVDEVCKWSREFKDGYYVNEMEVDRCAFFLDSIVDNLKHNYRKSAESTCQFCGLKFSGYFANERCSDHEVSMHEEEIMSSVGETMIFLFDMIKKLDVNEMMKEIDEYESKFEGKNLK